MPTEQNCVCKPDLGSKFSAVSRTTIFSTVVRLLKLSFNLLLASTAWWMLGNWSSVSNITCLSVSTRRNFSVFQKHAKPSLTCPAFRLKTPTQTSWMEIKNEYYSWRLISKVTPGKGVWIKFSFCIASVTFLPSKCPLWHSIGLRSCSNTFSSTSWRHIMSAW